MSPFSLRRIRRFMVVPFLPVREDFHPKRNQARQKLATLPKNRFKDLASDVFHELCRRYPEFQDEQVCLCSSLQLIPTDRRSKAPHMPTNRRPHLGPYIKDRLRWLLSPSRIPCVNESGCATIPLLRRYLA